MFSMSECLVESEDDDWDGTLQNAHLVNIVRCFWENMCFEFADESVDCEALVENKFGEVLKAAAKKNKVKLDY